MKIGILTLPLHTNYGGILQAYALLTALERMGHEVEVLDKPDQIYRPLWRNAMTFAKRLTLRVFGKNVSLNYQKEYNTIYRRIIQERLSPLYILCDYYANEFSTEELNSYRQLFKQDAFTTGVSLLSSHPNGNTFLSTKYTEWGI